MYIFILIFIILTLLHPLGDFLAPRKLHYIVVINPFHLLYDVSPLRRHHLYHTERDEYWRWLGVDQFMHVVLNLVLAAIVEIGI